MGSGTFYPSVSGDDTLRFGASSFYSALEYVVLGNDGGDLCHLSVRFPLVTIPKGKTVTTAYIRFFGYLGKTGTVVRSNIHFNDVDNAVAPSSASEFDNLALTAGISWDGLPAGVYGAAMDTPSLITLVQGIVNKGGWVADQAMQVIIKDDGSDSNANRWFSGIEYLSGSAKAELHLEWEDNIILACPPFSSTTSITADLQPQLAVPPISSLSVLSCGAVFNGRIIECASFVSDSSITTNIQFQISCPPFSSLSQISAFLQVQLEALPFESVTTLVSPTIWDGAAWSAWITVNKHQITRLYYFTLTGDGDATTDVTIPISSWQARRKSGEPTFLSVVIPWTAAYQSQIEARTHGVMQIRMAYIINGVEQYREIVCQADYETMRDDHGGRNHSMTLTGHKTESFTQKTIDLLDVIYVSNDDGDYRYRCATCNMFLNPGDIAKYDGNEITVAQIVIMVGVENGVVTQSMDVEENST